MWNRFACMKVTTWIVQSDLASLPVSNDITFNGLSKSLPNRNALAIIVHGIESTSAPELSIEIGILIVSNKTAVFMIHLSSIHFTIDFQFFFSRLFFRSLFTSFSVSCFVFVLKQKEIFNIISTEFHGTLCQHNCYLLSVIHLILTQSGSCIVFPIFAINLSTIEVNLVFSNCQVHCFSIFCNNIELCN